ncbi:hypothetical protein BCS99_15770 [Vibrio breoganii]|nr:hypothetical protein A1QG_15795 [Vibrio breoganii ZF-29]PMK31261.1 hypothetical protein BCU03_07395 [Vibrio breoganii]PML38816.1 hypothetical protein BCT77_13150 [Vibrio breoganii]PMM89428.1 hypothetical protein BCT44_17470 [Vibrio breoganii]PMO73131.1 hypothetical protein BCT02_01775 [Vibrio breoganii]
MVVVSADSVVKHVEKSVLETDAIPSGNTVWLYTNKDAERKETLYRARFVTQMTTTCLSKIDFSSPQVLDQINRKTTFIEEDGQLRGERPAGLLTITFDTDVEESDSLTQTPAYFSVKQRLYNYNMFVEEARFSFVLSPTTASSMLVDVSASNRVSNGIPGWVNNMFQSNVEDKVLHFQSALIGLCSK